MKRIALLILAWMALAGCGQQKDGGAAATASGPQTLRLAFFPNVTHAVALIGTDNGAFARTLGPNVKIEEQIFTAGPSEIEALFAGQVDIGYIGPGPALNGFLKSKGKALRIIAGASSGGTALVVRADSGITNIQGLAGKRVTVPQTGGTQDISLRHAMQQAQLASTDKGGNVTVLQTTPADTLTLFVKKEVDAAWVTEPWISRLVKEGNGRVLTDERDLWPNKRFATTVVVARQEFLEKHPDLVQQFLAAHVQVVDWIAANPAEAAKIVGDRIRTLTGKALPADVLKGSFSRAEFTYDPLRETVLTFADWSKSLGYLREDQSAFNDLFDLKPLNAALSQQHKTAIP